MFDSPIIEDAVSIVPVKDIEATVNFYADVLGFERRMVSNDKTFAIVIHGKAAIHFAKTTDEQALRAAANNISVYLWVRQIDKLYEQLKPKLDLLPKNRVRAPFNQPYEMREFHIKDPDGCLLLFGENV
jgi:catechol 2,3-dioxygenase-like lactoylglutathione lyase family enzyme